MRRLLLSTALAALLSAGSGQLPASAQPTTSGEHAQHHPPAAPPGPAPGSAVPAPPNPALSGPSQPPGGAERVMPPHRMPPHPMAHGPTAREMSERMRAMRQREMNARMRQMMRGITIPGGGGGNVIVIPPIIILGGDAHHEMMMRHHGRDDEADRSSAAEPTEPGSDNPVAAYMAANTRMHRDMAIDFTGDPDKDFALLMIAHHQGAVDMARIVLEHGDDPEIKQLAQDIVQAQEAEIVTLRDWLARNR